MTAQSFDPMDPVFLRGLTQQRIGRRDLFRYAGAGVGAVSLSAILAACSSSSTPASSASAASTALSMFDGNPAGNLNFANWTNYMDKAKDPNTGQIIHPSLDLFTKETGIKVNYQEVIDSLEGFFGKIQPTLQQGGDTGYDIMVITNGRVFDMMNRDGYFVPLPRDRFPNFDKYASSAVKDPSYDPGNKVSIAYQSGITGLGWDPAQVAQLRPANPTITSIKDLFDPAFKGKVGMFGDTLDMPSLALLGIGVDPEKSTPSDWAAAAATIAKARDAGIVRQFFPGSGYINALSNGDTAVTMAWSGDIFQANLSGASSGLQFTIPTEGGVIWTDNMTIPPHAQHPVDAITYMDYIFQPRIMAMMVEWINYVSPVPAAADVILADAAAATDLAGKKYLTNVASSPLVFPTAADLGRLYNYRTLTAAEDTPWLAVWSPLSQ